MLRVCYASIPLLTIFLPVHGWLSRPAVLDKEDNCFVHNVLMHLTMLYIWLGFGDVWSRLNAWVRRLSKECNVLITVSQDWICGQCSGLAGIEYMTIALLRPSQRHQTKPTHSMRHYGTTHQIITLIHTFFMLLSYRIECKNKWDILAELFYNRSTKPSKLGKCNLGHKT